MTAVDYQEGVAPGAQEVELAWRLWRAPRPRASVLVVHGLGEHSGRYDELARFLAAEGLSVFAFDLRGHGRSPGPRGDVDAFPRFLEDLLRMEDEAERRVPGVTARILLGHSLGGLICIRRLQVFRGPYTGAVISAPWLATALPRWLRRVGRFLGMALPGLPLPAGISPDRLSRDPEAVRAWREDSLIHTRVTGRCFLAAEREQEKALVSPWPRELPSLFLVPENDRVVRSPVTLGFVRTIVGEGGRVEILKGREHEPFNDLGRQEVYRTVAEWLASVLPPP